MTVSGLNGRATVVIPTAVLRDLKGDGFLPEYGAGKSGCDDLMPFEAYP